ncbi:MAG: carbohydrate ABC transporter permease [Clostridiales bacterium]|jgi:multiple sugar transport system permease protein|nr:carbohydrate ABC transporter permease [Clostridiales bacterium]
MRKLLARLYGDKSVGSIRAYDAKSPLTQILSVFFVLICALIIVIVLLPVIWVVFAGFKDIRELNRSTSFFPASFDLSSYVKTWGQLHFTEHYINSFIVLIGGVFCAVIFNGLLAYALGILRPPGYKIVFGLVMWTMLIPPTTSVVAQYLNIRSVVETLAGLMNVKSQETLLAVAPLWFIMGANAFWLVLFKQFFEELPKDYIEAATLDGCSDLRVFTHIILPLSKPIMMVVAIFAATAAWSDFLLPHLLLNNSRWSTVMVRLFEFRSAMRVNDTDRLRAVVFSIIPPIIIFSLFQKQITSGIATGGIKG